MFLSGEFCSQNQKIFYYYDLSFYFYFFKASRSKGLATEVKELLVPKELENVLLHFFFKMVCYFASSGYSYLLLCQFYFSATGIYKLSLPSVFCFCLYCNKILYDNTNY